MESSNIYPFPVLLTCGAWVSLCLRGDAVPPVLELIPQVPIRDAACFQWQKRPLGTNAKQLLILSQDGGDGSGSQRSLGEAGAAFAAGWEC